MTTTTRRTFQAVLSPKGDFRVHAAGCRDLADLTKTQHATPLDIASTTRDGIAAELMADLIEENDLMTEDDALDYVRFLPCTGL